MTAEWAAVLAALMTAVVGGAWTAFRYLRARGELPDSSKETYLQIYKEVCNRFYNAAAMANGAEILTNPTFGDFHTPAHVEQLLPILKPMERRAIRSFFKHCAEFERELIKGRGEGKYKLQWVPTDPPHALSKDFYRIRVFVVQALGSDLDEREIFDEQE